MRAWQQKIERFNTHQIDSGREQPSKHAKPERLLGNSITKAASETAKNPTRAINTLKVYFEQRAWHQRKDANQRSRVREDMANILMHSYRKKNQPEEAEKVLKILESEKAIFNQVEEK